MDMKTFHWLLALVLLPLLTNGAAVAGGEGGKSVMCFFQRKSVYRFRGGPPFNPEDLDVSLCTHLVYNGAKVNLDLEVVPRDREMDLLEDGGEGLYNRTLKLKEVKPELQIFLHLVVDLEDLFHPGPGNRAALAYLARKAADFVHRFGFDGINFNHKWNIEGYDDWLQILHEEFFSRNLKIITVSSTLSRENINRIDLTKPIWRNFDLIVVASYLKRPNSRTGIFSSLNELESVVKNSTDHGIPPERLVVAIPAFSYSMKLSSVNHSGVGAEVCHEREGDMGCSNVDVESWELMRHLANSSEEWVVERDEGSGQQYAYSRKSLQWVSFEDTESVRAKARFVQKKNLAGVAIISEEMEDFKGEYSEGGETFPLTRAAHNALNGAD